MTERLPDPPPDDSPATARARARHDALISATMAAIDALPPLPPDAPLRSFEVLKAMRSREEGGR